MQPAPHILITTASVGSGTEGDNQEKLKLPISKLFTYNLPRNRKVAEISIVCDDRIQKFISRRKLGLSDVRIPQPGLNLEPPHLPEIEAISIRTTKI